MNAVSRLLDLGLFVMRVALCLFMAVWAGGEAINGLASRSWPVTPGTVIASSLKKVERKWGASYDAEIRYEYKVNGKTYRGDRIQFGSKTLTDASATVAKYPLNAEIEVRYEKTNPALSALEQGFNQVPVLASLLGAILMMVLGFKEFGTPNRLKTGQTSSPISTQDGPAKTTTTGQSHTTPTITLLALVAMALAIPWALDHLAPKGPNAEWLTVIVLFGGGLSLVMLSTALPALIAHFARKRQFQIAALLADFNGFIFGTFFPVSVEATLAAALQSDIAREQLAFAKANRLSEKAIAAGTQWLNLTNKHTQEDNTFNLTKQAMKNNLQFQQAHCREIISLCHHDMGESYLMLHRYDEAMNQVRLAEESARDLMSTGKLNNGSSVQPGVLALSLALTLKGRLETIQGSYEAAIENLKNAIAQRETLTTQFDEKRAEILAHLAATYSLQGEFRRAKEAIEAGLAMVAKIKGPQVELAAATLLHSQGQLLMREGNLKEAEKNLTQCLELRSNFLLANHPQIADTLVALAELHTLQGQNAKALDLNKKAQKLLEVCQVSA